MCNFFSCLVDKKKRVYWKGGVDNHHELIEIFKLDDNTTDQQRIKFAKIEIVPPSGILFYPLEQWKFKVDESVRPEWFSPAHEKACWEALGKNLKKITEEFGGSLDLRGYKHPLQEGFTHCGGSLDLIGYEHPLPEGFTHCGGSLYLIGYKHPLPEGFTHCGGSLYLRGYKHPLPKGLKN